MAERPEDLNLPNAVVTRIVKEALPDGVNVSKDARLAISKAASVFVLYATSCANNFAMQHKRKTISGGDVLEAMSEMEFDRFVAPLKQSLDAFKKEQKGKKEAAEQKKKDKEQNASKEDNDDRENADADDAEDEVEEIEVDEEEEEEDGEDET